MTTGIRKDEPDPQIIYADIIDLPHWQSPIRAHMSLYDRAAQFAPFSALTGYDDMIHEEARSVDNKIELNDEALAVLNRKLGIISDLIAEGTKPLVSITYFIPDPLKPGGRYETITEKIRKVDAVEQAVVLDKRAGYADMYVTIKIADIWEIYGEEIDYALADGTLHT